MIFFEASAQCFTFDVAGLTFEVTLHCVRE
jgi:hypothetical protein